MATYRELLSRVDLLLGEPAPYAPSEPTRWEVLRGAAQSIFNAALNSPVNWTVGNTSLSVVADVDTYSLNASDFGKDVLVETIDLSDPQHVSRPVSRVSLQSQIFTYFPQSGDESTASGSLHTARSLAIYREDGEVKVRITPTPTEAATYRIWYEKSSPNTESDSNSLFSPAGESYLVALCALQLIPYCTWAGMTKDEITQRKRELLPILSASVTAHERAWKQYLSNDRQSGTVILRGFGDEEEEW